MAHGDGLTSLQFRAGASGVTGEIRQEAKSDLSAPVRLRIERRGDNFTMLAGKAGGPLASTGPVATSLTGAVYVGLAICSHDTNVLETAVISNVTLQALPSAGGNRAPAQRYRSKMAIYDLRDRSIRTLYEAEAIFEAPNWSRDGKHLIFNTEGRLYKLPVDAI